MQASSLQRKLLHAGFPCKVIDCTSVKQGNHVSPKATIVGVDIFTNKKYQAVCSIAATVQIPIVTNKEYEVSGISQNEIATLLHFFYERKRKHNQNFPKMTKEFIPHSKKHGNKKVVATFASNLNCSKQKDQVQNLVHYCKFKELRCRDQINKKEIYEKMITYNMPKPKYSEAIKQLRNVRRSQKFQKL